MSQQINLFNPAFEPKKSYATSPALVAAFMGVALVLAVLVVMAQSELAALVQQAEAVKTTLTAREASKAAATTAFVAPRKSEALQQQFEQATLSYANLQKVAAILEQGHGGDVRGYSAYFRALARRTSEGLWLTGLQIQGNGESISLQGRAIKASLLPGYLAGLSNESVLRGKKFAQLELHEPLPAASAAASAPASASAAPPRYVEFTLQAAPAEAAGKAVQP